MRAAIHALLTKHLTSLEDETERQHAERLRGLLDAPGDPFARDHYTPGHFTASAFVLSPDGQQILLIWHSKLLRWLQPGGHFEPTDGDLLAAARRELAEEVGLVDVPLAAPVEGGGYELFDVDVHVIPARPATEERAEEPEHEHFDLRLLFRAKSHLVAAGSDAVDVRWVPLADVGQIESLESDESVVRAVRKLVSRGR